MKKHIPYSAVMAICLTPAVASAVIPLQSNQWSIPFSGNQDSRTLFSFVMPDTPSVSIRMQGGEGDADIYLGTTEDVSSNNYVDKSISNNNNEAITLYSDVTFQAGQTYFIAVEGWNQYKNTQLKYTPLISGNDANQIGLDQTISLSANTGATISLDLVEIPSHVKNIHVTLRGDNGDADLKVDLKSPFYGHIVQSFSSESSTSNETLDIHKGENSAIIHVTAWRGFNNAELSVTTTD